MAKTRKPSASRLTGNTLVVNDGSLLLSGPAMAGYAAAIAATTLIYSLITGHIWEDALITLRSAENLINGHGLTYHVGTRVHTFTSPINVLLLAVSYLLTGKGTYIATLWLYRVFAIVAVAGGGVLFLQANARVAPQWYIALWWLALVYLFDGKSIVFSTSGMETAYMLLFVAWAIYLLAPPRPERWLARGLCWAGLMWTRPDGCVYIAALGAGELLFSGFPRKQVFASLLKSAAMTGALYSPWFLWAWSYYGSPVPNTIIAKSNPLGVTAQFWDMMDTFPDCVIARAARVFRHVYCDFGFLTESMSTQRFNDGVTKSLGIFCLIYWLFPVNDRLGRMASYSFCLLCVYFAFQRTVYPWYFPPAALLGFTTLARAFAIVATTRQPQLGPRGLALKKPILTAVLIVLAVGQFALFALTTWEMKIQQAEIETGTRAQLGIWLREHSKPDDAVYLEPLGYIGYFSGLTMHDYPGLASPTVVKLRREKQLDLLGAIKEVLAYWVVLRPHEYRALMNSPDGKFFEENYELAQQFSALPRLEKYAYIPGRGYVMNDAMFGVFRRRYPGTTP